MQFWRLIRCSDISPTEMIVRILEKGQMIENGDWIKLSAAYIASEEPAQAIHGCLCAQISVCVGRLPSEPRAKCDWSELGERNACLMDKTPRK